MANDLAQEVMSTIYTRSSDLPTGALFRPGLYKVARNVNQHDTDAVAGGGEGRADPGEGPRP